MQYYAGNWSMAIGYHALMGSSTLANNLKPLLSAEEIRALGIEPSLRPEQLSLSDFGHLTAYLSKNH